MAVLFYALRITKTHKSLLRYLFRLTLLWGVTASADPIDQVADFVLGQPNFSSNAANNGGFSFGFNNPHGVVVDSLGNVYVADQANSRVLIYLDPKNTDKAADFVLGQPDLGAVGGNNGGLNASSLFSPFDVEIDTAGNVYVADSSNNRVLVYLDPLNTDTIADMVFGQPNFSSNAANNGGVNASSLNTPTGIEVDAIGNVYIADTANNRVLKFDTPLVSDTEADMVFGQPNFSSNAANNGGVSASSLSSPRHVKADIANNVYVTDAVNHRVLIYLDPENTDTVADRVIGQPDFISQTLNNGGLDAGSLWFPQGIEVDTANNVYIADFANSRILEYHTPLITDTEADIVLGQPNFFSSFANNDGLDAGSLWFPVDMTVDSSGNIYVADQFNHRILSYDGTPPIANTILTCTGYDNPFANPLALKKKSKRIIPLQMTLTDSNGVVITDTDIESSPVVNVLFSGKVYGEVPPDTDDLLETGNANDDNIFRFDDSTNKWVYNLGTKQFAAPGVYTVKPIEGDDSYTIDASTGCIQTFERFN